MDKLQDMAVSGVDANSVLAKSVGLNIENLKQRVKSVLTELERIDVPRLSPSDSFDIRSEVRRYEVELIRAALRVTGNHQARAARMLGLSATTLNSKIKRFKIEP